MIPMPLFFFWFIFEILIFATLASRFGFLVTLVGYFVPTLLATAIFSIYRNQGLNQLQASLKRGQEPTSEILHSGFKMLGLILLWPPTFLTRCLGFLLLLPGFRHAIVFVVQFWFLKKMMKFMSGTTSAFGGPQSRFFRWGPASFVYTDLRGNRQQTFDNDTEFDQPPEREAQVIDIKPISSHRSNPES